MTRVRIGRTVWVTGAPRLVPLGHARVSVAAVWGRTAAVLAVTGTLAATTLVSTPKAEQSKDAAAVEEVLPKDGDRVETWQPPVPPQMAEAEPAEVDALSTGSLFAAKPMAAPVRFGSHAEPIATVSAFKPWIPAAPAPAEWIEQEFAQATVIDGRSLQAGPVRIQLLGLDLPLPEQVCRTLDGRFEPCATRAATQLELLTRHRKVICHYRADLAPQSLGRCRVGTSDLAERMVQTGYVWRSSTAAAR